MEQIIITALGGLLANALSAIVGNRADAGVTAAWQAIVHRLKKGGKPVNHDLQRAVLRSFILALKTICDDCISELKTKKKEHTEDIRWLKQKQQSLDNELKRVGNAKYVEPSLQSLNEIELLLMPDGTLAQERVHQVKDKLIQIATRDGEPPSCYKEKVEKELFERMCAYFVFEIKNNQVVRNIFEGQLLAQIDVTLQGQQLTVERIETSLYDVAKAVPQVVEKLDEIVKHIRGRREPLSLHLKQAKAFEIGWLIMLWFRRPKDWPSKLEQLRVHLDDLKIRLPNSVESYFDPNDTSGELIQLLAEQIGGQLAAKSPNVAPYFEAAYNLIIDAFRKGGSGIQKILSAIDVPSELRLPRQDLVQWLNDIHAHFERMLHNSRA